MGYFVENFWMNIDSSLDYSNSGDHTELMAYKGYIYRSISKNTETVQGCRDGSANMESNTSRLVGYYCSGASLLYCLAVYQNEVMGQQKKNGVAEDAPLH